MFISRQGHRLLFGQLMILTLLVACNVPTEPQSPVIIEEPSAPRTAEDLLALAELSDRPQAVRYRISAAEQLLGEQRFGLAREAVDAIPDASNLSNSLRIRLTLARAEIALELGPREQALVIFEEDMMAGLEQQPTTIQRRVVELRARTLMATGRDAEAITLLANTPAPGSSDTQRRNEAIWQSLQRLSDSQLAQLTDQAESYELLGWLELNRVIRSREHSIPSQIDAIGEWQELWNRHSAVNRLPAQLAALQRVWSDRPRHIALLLSVQSQVGRAVQEGFFSAYYEALETDPDVPQISVFDTTNVSQVRSLYESAVNAGADLIVGPLDKELVRQLGGLRSLPVPTLALNYTDFRTRNSASLYQFGLAPEDEIRHASSRAWNAGYRNAAVIAPSSPDYQRLQQNFIDNWERLGGRVASTVSYGGDGEYADTVKQLLAIDASENRAARLESILPRGDIEFTPTRRGDIDFIFLMANPRQGRQIKPTLAFYFAEDIPVYALSSIYDGSSNQVVNQDLDGIIFTETPWVLEQTRLKQEINSTLRPTQGLLQRLRALGVDSYRLYARLEQLAAGELSSFGGATGLLTMDENGIIGRVPQSAIFIDGAAVVLDETEEGLALN